MADNFYQIIVSGAKQDYRTSRNKAEVSKLVAGYKRDAKVGRIQVTHGTKNNMKMVSDWTRSKKLTATQAVRKERREIVKKQESERGRRLAKLDRYNIDFTYVKGGDTAKRSAVGYRDMRQVRSETWKSSRKHKGGRAYRVETVNVTKGRRVK